MTEEVERANAFIVVLDHDMRSEEMEATIIALKCIKGVLRVIPHEANFSTAIAEERVKHDLHIKLMRVLYPKKEESE